MNLFKAIKQELIETQFRLYQNPVDIIGHIIVISGIAFLWCFWSKSPLPALLPVAWIIFQTIMKERYKRELKQIEAAQMKADIEREKARKSVPQ